jgi:Ca2+-binding EF-hand superfamily protein
MKRPIFSLLALGCFLTTCGSSVNGQDLERLFSRLDQDGDGFIDQDEMPEQAKMRLVNRDSDGDGKVSRSEMLSASDSNRSRAGGEARKRRPEAGKKPDQASNSPDRLKQLLKRLDKNGNEKLELSEVPEKLRQRLSMLDKDGDEIISEAEMKAAAGQMGERFKGKKSQSNGANPNGKPGDSRFEAIVNQLPRNEAGQVDLEAMEDEGRRQRLSQFDTNDDGLLDKTELKAIAEKFKSNVRPGQPKKGKDERKQERGSERSPQLPKRPADGQSKDDGQN